MGLVKRYIYKTLQVYETLHHLSLICEIKYEFLLKNLFNNKMELLFFLKYRALFLLLITKNLGYILKKEVKIDFPILFY